METIYNNLVQLLTYDPQSPIIFSSGLFLVLFVGFTLVYYLLHNTFTPRILFVTLFSYYFYYKSSGVYFILLAVVTLSDYLIAKAIHNQSVCYRIAVKNRLALQCQRFESMSCRMSEVECSMI